MDEKKVQKGGLKVPTAYQLNTPKAMVRFLITVAGMIKNLAARVKKVEDLPVDLKGAGVVVGDVLERVTILEQQVKELEEAATIPRPEMSDEEFANLVDRLNAQMPDEEEDTEVIDAVVEDQVGDEATKIANPGPTDAEPK